jgi:hypothetical protein
MRRVYTCNRFTVKILVQRMFIATAARIRCFVSRCHPATLVHLSLSLSLSLVAGHLISPPFFPAFLRWLLSSRPPPTTSPLTGRSPSNERCIAWTILGSKKLVGWRQLEPGWVAAAKAAAMAADDEAASAPMEAPVGGEPRDSPSPNGFRTARASAPNGSKTIARGWVSTNDVVMAWLLEQGGYRKAYMAVDLRGERQGAYRGQWNR